MKKFKMLVYMPTGGEDYANFIKKKFNAEVVSKIDMNKALPNLVIFTGGADVDPSYYDEEVGKFTSVNKARDIEEFKIFDNMRAYNIPMLGICRGAQFLCVASGGKLIQHVSGHALGGTHKVTIEGYGKHEITSTHHQMMYPFDMHSAKFTVLGHSTKFLSNIYLNGHNENLSVVHDFLEPEIVHFPQSNAIAIQGHPEFTHCPKNTVEACLNIISDYLQLNHFENEK